MARRYSIKRSRSKRKKRGTYISRLRRYLKTPKGKRTAKIVGLTATAATLGYIAYRNREKIKALIQRMKSKMKKKV